MRAVFLFWKDWAYTTPFAFSKEAESFLGRWIALSTWDISVPKNMPTLCLPVCFSCKTRSHQVAQIQISDPPTSTSLLSAGITGEPLFSATELLLKSVLSTPNCFWRVNFVFTSEKFFELYLWAFNLFLSEVFYPWIPSNLQGQWVEKAGFPRRQYLSPQIILWWIKCLMFPFVRGYKRNNWGESPSDTCVVWETCGCTSLFCNTNV